MQDSPAQIPPTNDTDPTPLPKSTPLFEVIYDQNETQIRTVETPTDSGQMLKLIEEIAKKTNEIRGAGEPSKIVLGGLIACAIDHKLIGRGRGISIARFSKTVVRASPSTSKKWTKAARCYAEFHGEPNPPVQVSHLLMLSKLERSIKFEVYKKAYEDTDGRVTDVTLLKAAKTLGVTLHYIPRPESAKSSIIEVGVAATNVAESHHVQIQDESLPSLGTDGEALDALERMLTEPMSPRLHADLKRLQHHLERQVATGTTELKGSNFEPFKQESEPAPACDPQAADALLAPLPADCWGDEEETANLETRLLGPLKLTLSDVESFSGLARENQCARISVACAGSQLGILVTLKKPGTPKVIRKHGYLAVVGEPLKFFRPIQHTIPTEILTIINLTWTDSSWDPLKKREAEPPTKASNKGFFSTLPLTWKSNPREQQQVNTN